MAKPGPLPENVLKLLSQEIDSVPHLEALLLLWQNPAQRWTDAEVATRVYVPVQTARQILEDLTRRRFLIAESGPEPRYAFDPKWDETTQLMPQVADTYRRHLVQVTQLIHSKASPGVREFARAFQLKKDER